MRGQGAGLLVVASGVAAMRVPSARARASGRGQDPVAQHRCSHARRRSWPTAARPRRKNFNIFYEIDGEEVGSVLRADEYGVDEDFSWVLLEPAEGA